MNLSEIIYFDNLKNLHIDIMFAASPASLVSDISKKFTKRKTKNLFYTIFGFYLKESNQFIVFANLYKSCRNKKNQDLFKTITIDHAIFDTKEEVINYLHNFIDNFEEHKRIVNQNLMEFGMINGNTAYECLVLWHKDVFNYFNFIIEQ